MSDRVDQICRVVDRVAGATVAPPVAELRARAARRRRNHALLATVGVAVAAGGIAAGVLATSTERSPGQQLHMTDGGAPIVRGGSSPSPFPSFNPNHTGYPDVCDGPIPADGTGRLTSTISWEGQDVMRPAGSDVATGITRTQALDRYAQSDFHSTGHPVAVFGLLSAPAPAQILPDGGSSPYFQQTPVWLVAVCDAPPGASTGGGIGPYRPPGTSPSPGPGPIGVMYMTFDTAGRQVGGVTITGRPSQAQLDEQFIHVPWQQELAQPGDDPRQVRISYPAAEPCATFDHLAVYETDTTVNVQVWLRHSSDDPVGCTPTERQQAVVGLNKPLGHRTLQDASPSPTGVEPVPDPDATTNPH